jgi:hypothetical protein
MPYQIQNDLDGAGPNEKTNDPHDTTTGGAMAMSPPQTFPEIIDAIEQCVYQSDQQHQAIMRLYQLILDAHQAETLSFLDPPDEVVALDFLDFVDALAAAPIFDDDTAPYRDVVRATRELVRLMSAGRITFRVSSDGA